MGELLPVERVSPARPSSAARRGTPPARTEQDSGKKNEATVKFMGCHHSSVDSSMLFRYDH